MTTKTPTVPDKTVSALKALGWTPPGEPAFDPEQLREMASQLLTWANAAEAGR